MNRKQKRVGSSTVSLHIPPHLLAEIEIKASLAKKDRDTYLVDLALADISFGASTQTDQDGIVVMNKAGHIRWVNIPFSAMSGYTLAELSGKTFDGLLQGPATEQGSVDAFREALEQKRQHLGPILNYPQNKRPYWVCRLLTPIADGARNLGFIALERRISSAQSFGRNGGKVTKEMEARLPSIRKAIASNPGQFGLDS